MSSFDNNRRLASRKKLLLRKIQEDLKLPVFSSKEFISKALLSSRKQASIANF
jgi:hypothetical protein